MPNVLDYPETPTATGTGVQQVQSRLDGEHHQLGSVTGVQFDHRPGDVGAYGVRTDHQLLGDLLVGRSGGDPRHQLTLTVGEAPDLRMRPDSGSAVAEVLDHPPGDRGPEQRPTVGDDPDRVEQSDRICVLGALMPVLGAVVAGNGYGWGTWKTVFTQGPSRRSTVLGR